MIQTFCFPRHVGIVALAVIFLERAGFAQKTVSLGFETGFLDEQSVGFTTVGGIHVTLQVGTGGMPTGAGFVARRGAPVTAFSPNDTPDPSDPLETTIGQFFYTDESTQPPTALAREYFLSFNPPVSTLHLDLLDYRDEGAASGDIATLTVFSDSLGGTIVGSDSFTIPSPLPNDGNIEHLAVQFPSALIRFARVSFSTPDAGTAIDNIEFTLGIGPGAPFCLGSGCPCGNDSAISGCTNSNGSGALLAASGSTSVAADDLVLTTTGCPPGNAGLYFMGGSTFVPVFVGDGLACTGGLFRFFPSVVSPPGVLTLTNPVANALAGQITPGDPRHFQAWYRDSLCGPPPVPCPSPCGNNSNLSNGYTVVFTP